MIQTLRLKMKMEWEPRLGRNLIEALGSRRSLSGWTQFAISSQPRLVHEAHFARVGARSLESPGTRNPYTGALFTVDWDLDIPSRFEDSYWGGKERFRTTEEVLSRLNLVSGWAAQQVIRLIWGPADDSAPPSLQVRCMSALRLYSLLLPYYSVHSVVPE